MAMLRMEDERLALYKEQKTDSERIQDAGQGVIDLAAIAFAVTGHPYISVALEGGNAVASGTRENYDEMYLRIMGICLFGAGEYLKYADTGTEALKVNTKAFSSLTAGEIKAITEEADLIRITMDSGKQLVYSRADLYVDDLIKLKKLEKLVASGKGSLLEQLIEVGFTVDDLADLGIKWADDLIKLGITSQDDLIKLGITNKDDLAKLGIHTGEEFNRLGIGSIDDFIKGAGNTVLDNANYAQKTYSNTFSADGRRIYTNLAGEPINTIDDLVNAINKGKVNVADLPVEYIIRDGNTLILNTRTSQALAQAGIPRSEWSVINRAGNSLFEELLTGQLTRNKLTSEGITTVRQSGGK